MRLLILLGVAALSLAACRNNDQADNNINVDENLTAENIVANDVTAIDAVTGEDANMAADVNYLEPETNNAAASQTNAIGNRGSSARRPARPATPPTTNTAEEPAANTTE